MPFFDCLRATDVEQTPRVLQLLGLFEIPPTKRSEQRWQINLPIEDFDWNIGLIVGPSGSGKSTVARDLFGAHLVSGYDWPENKSLVDGFPSSMSIKDITGLVSSVGFSSPPAWLRPFRCLSNGEQFRATIARALAESPELAVIDEFTSVVGRQVAKIASAAVAKAVRRRRQKFIAVSCHDDIEEWLCPDWILEMPAGQFTRRSLRQRPRIELEIQRVHRSAWKLFKHHHYLNTSINVGAHCFVGFIDNSPVAFASAVHSPGRVSFWREHRTVCLPDFQGVVIGNALSEYVASLFQATGKPYHSTTSSPAMIRYRARSPLWFLNRKPSRTSSECAKFEVSRRFHARSGIGDARASNRFTAGFRYVGPARPDEARAFGII